MSASQGDPLLRRGPLSLPNSGYGPFTSTDAKLIFDRTGVWCKVKGVVGGVERVLMMRADAGTSDDSFKAARAMVDMLFMKAHSKPSPSQPSSSSQPWCMPQGMPVMPVMGPHGQVMMQVGHPCMAIPGHPPPMPPPMPPPTPWPPMPTPPPMPPPPKVVVDATTTSEATAPKRKNDAVDAVPPKKAPKKTPKKRKVRMRAYTLGMAAIDLDSRSDWSNDLVGDIKKNCKAFFPDTPDFRLVVDCRMFHWPRGPSGHTGEHTVAIGSVVNNASFRIWCSSLKRLLQDPDKQVENILFVCKRGINRSVSCACIFAAIHGLVQPTCLCIEDLDRRNICHHCDDCKLITRQKKMFSRVANRGRPCFPVPL